MGMADTPKVSTGDVTGERRLTDGFRTCKIIAQLFFLTHSVEATPLSSIVEILMQQLAGSASSDIGKSLGANEQTTQTAIAAALPLLLGAFARNSDSTQGAEALHGALAKDHDGSVLDNLAGYLGAPNLDDGSGIVRHAFGDRQAAVERGVSKASGLDMANAAKLLTVLAPVVMGMIGRNQRQQGLDSAGLAELLGGERKRVEHQDAPAAGLGRLLDSDGDGDIGDDIAKLGKGLLQGFLKSR